MIAVVCTDRGQHPRRRITFTGSRSPVQLEAQRAGGVRLECSTCRRCVELGEARWSRLLDGLRKAGRSQVDMSYL